MSLPHAAEGQRSPSVRRFRMTTGGARLLVCLVAGSVLSACGGDAASMSCNSFMGSDTAAQIDTIKGISESRGFIGVDDDFERLRSGAERACGADADQKIGDIVDGFISALSD